MTVCPPGVRRGRRPETAWGAFAVPRAQSLNTESHTQVNYHLRVIMRKRHFQHARTQNATSHKTPGEGHQRRGTQRFLTSVNQTHRRFSFWSYFTKLSLPWGQKYGLLDYFLKA